MTAAHADAAKLLAENVQLVEALKGLAGAVDRLSRLDSAPNTLGTRTEKADRMIPAWADVNAAQRLVDRALAASPQSVAASEVIEAAETWCDVRGEMDFGRLLAAVDRLRALREGK